MQYGLIGEHLGHSYSREIHESIADYRYELQELRPEELGPFLTAKEFRGINVTIPYKQAVIPYLDEISDRARAIGAVNTVVNLDGRLYGDNTDFAGMLALAAHVGVQAEGKKVLILGTGGTSKTAHAVMESLHAGEIVHVSRSAGAGAVSYDDVLRLHSDAQILINTTPVGMFPKGDAMPVDPSAFPALEAVLDAVYNPLQTELVLAARALGIPAEGGLYMLAAQAVYACGVFLGREMNPALTERAYRRVAQEKQNLVLIGMPTCGKTTVGGLLADMTGRRLLDTDVLLAQRLGVTAAEYIEAHGEPAFREQERETVRQASMEAGCILATGGGAVLDARNVHELKKNGVLIFLDRSLANLCAAPDRPLSSDPARLAAMFAARRPIYLAAADIRVNGDLPAEKVAKSVLEELTK